MNNRAECKKLLEDGFDITYKRLSLNNVHRTILGNQFQVFDQKTNFFKLYTSSEEAVAKFLELKSNYDRPNRPMP